MLKKLGAFALLISLWSHHGLSQKSPQENISDETFTQIKASAEERANAFQEILTSEGTHSLWKIRNELSKSRIGNHIMGKTEAERDVCRALFLNSLLKNENYKIHLDEAKVFLKKEKLSIVRIEGNTLGQIASLGSQNMRNPSVLNALKKISGQQIGSEKTAITVYTSLQTIAVYLAHSDVTEVDGLKVLREITAEPSACKMQQIKERGIKVPSYNDIFENFSDDYLDKINGSLTNAENPVGAEQKATLQKLYNTAWAVKQIKDAKKQS